MREHRSLSDTARVLVTTATGTIGASLVPALLERGARVRVMTRRPEAVDHVPTDGRVEVAVADLDDPASVAAALAGVDTAFLNTPSSPNAARRQIDFADAADAADAAGVPLVVLSQYAAAADSPVRFLRWHARVEDHLRTLQVGSTVLRPNLFLQALVAYRDPIVAHGRFGAPIGDVAVSAVDTRDIADVAAVALTEPGHHGRTYTLTGPRAVTFAEIADALSVATGRAVAFDDVSPASFAGALDGLLPAWQLEGLLEDFAHYRRGEAAAVDPAVEQVTGRPARGLAAFAADHAALFRPAEDVVLSSRVATK